MCPVDGFIVGQDVWLQEGYYYTPRAHHITQEALAGESRKVDACVDTCSGSVSVLTAVGIAAGAVVVGVAGGIVGGVVLSR